MYKDLRANMTLCRTYVDDMAALGEKIIVYEDEPATASTDMGMSCISVTHQLLSSVNWNFLCPSSPSSHPLLSSWWSYLGSHVPLYLPILTCSYKSLMLLQLQNADFNFVQAMSHTPCQASMAPLVFRLPRTLSGTIRALRPPLARTKHMPPQSSALREWPCWAGEYYPTTPSPRVREETSSKMNELRGSGTGSYQLLCPQEKLYINELFGSRPYYYVLLFSSRGHAALDHCRSS